MRRPSKVCFTAYVLVILGEAITFTASLQAEDVQLSVDAAKTGPEISPYIYGQFIEHLGRCIHDGIWAEKLIDRKFLLEPGKKWEAIAPPGADAKVMHDTAGAYAGEHCMAVWVKDAKNGRCGIQQGGIGAFESYFCLGDAIAVARGLHEMLRSADLVQAAAWPQTVNVLGAVKITQNYAAMDPAGHVLAIYGTELGGTLVPLELPKHSPLDAVAAIDKKRGVLTIGLINYSPRQAVSLKLILSGKAPASTKGWRIQGAALGDFNIPGMPEIVTVAPLEGAWTPDQPLNLPAHSITVVQFK
jgi:alpha-L-arabinofuranosidase